MESPYSGKRESGYRPDIDGLRAVAIILVVLNHLSIGLFSGGYIGVDIFFVISGYLITGNVARGIARDRFTIAEFYERRLRRIAPALYMLLAVMSILVLFVFPPGELMKYAHSMLAALFSYANLYFATVSGYFKPIDTKILLHTWSLGVEEQFYLVLPVCMVLLARFPQRATRWAIWIGATLSFLSAIWMTWYNRDLSFYMPFTRAWELLGGSALALGMVRIPKTRWSQEAAGLLGVLLLAFCVVRYSESTPFPGLTALPAVLGAMLLIAVGEHGETYATRFLTWRPMVFIGLISYSMYLWHLPLVLALHPGSMRNEWKRAAIGLSISIVAGTLSWWLVEQPFRTGRWKKLPQKQVFLAAGAGAAVLAGLALLYIGSRGLPSRFSPAAQEVGSYLYAPQQMRSGSCFVENHFSEFDPKTCLTPESGKENVLLIGDSHAAAVWYGLSHAAPQIHLLEASAGGCFVVMGNYDRSFCGQLRRYLYETYLPTHHVDKVILVQRWKSPDDLAQFQPVLQWFADRKIPVIVIGPVQEYAGPEPLLLVTGLKWGKPRYAATHQKGAAKAIDDGLRAELQGRPGIQYASLYNAICPNGVCQQYADPVHNIPMMIDDNHLSNVASLLMMQKMIQSGDLTP